MSTSTRNLLLEDIDYKLQETRLGVWRSYMYPSGQLFQEFTAHARVFGLPLVHYTYGRSPETGRRVIAKGIVAITRIGVRNELNWATNTKYIKNIATIIARPKSLNTSTVTSHSPPHSIL